MCDFFFIFVAFAIDKYHVDYILKDHSVCVQIVLRYFIISNANCKEMRLRRVLNLKTAEMCKIKFNDGINQLALPIL